MLEIESRTMRMYLQSISKTGFVCAFVLFVVAFSTTLIIGATAGNNNLTSLLQTSCNILCIFVYCFEVKSILLLLLLLFSTFGYRCCKLVSLNTLGPKEAFVTRCFPIDNCAPTDLV